MKNQCPCVACLSSRGTCAWSDFTPDPTPVEVAAVVRGATSAAAWAFAITIAAFVAIAYLIVTL
jgi:hypothetical protein